MQDIVAVTAHPSPRARGVEFKLLLRQFTLTILAKHTLNYELLTMNYEL
jgi:hypothetical protein